MIDLGDRFRLLVNEVDGVVPDQPLPKLPVARAFWTPRPDLKTAAAAWIYAGGPHHMVFSQALTCEHVEDFAEMVGVECLPIDARNAIGRNQESTSLERSILRRVQSIQELTRSLLRFPSRLRLRQASRSLASRNANRRQDAGGCSAVLPVPHRSMETTHKIPPTRSFRRTNREC